MAAPGRFLELARESWRNPAVYVKVQVPRPGCFLASSRGDRPRWTIRACREAPERPGSSSLKTPLKRQPREVSAPAEDRP